jgi:hypothetical protein
VDLLHGKRAGFAKETIMASTHSIWLACNTCKAEYNSEKELRDHQTMSRRCGKAELRNTASQDDGEASPETESAGE